MISPLFELGCEERFVGVEEEGGKDAGCVGGRERRGM